MIALGIPKAKLAKEVGVSGQTF